MKHTKIQNTISIKLRKLKSLINKNMDKQTTKQTTKQTKKQIKHTQN